MKIKTALALLIEDDKGKQTTYRVKKLLDGWRLIKIDEPDVTYDVGNDDGCFSCECKCALMGKQVCRHVKALLAEGLLSASPPVHEYAEPDRDIEYGEYR